MSVRRWWNECKERQTQKTCLYIFVCVPHVLDYIVRTRNFAFHKGYKKRLLCKPHSGIGSHSPLAIILPLLSFYFIIYGPTLSWRGAEPVFVLLAFVALFVLLVCVFHERWLFLIHWLMLTGVAAFVFLNADPGAVEHDGEMYRHILIPVAAVLLSTGMLISRFLAHVVFGVLHREAGGGGDTYLQSRVKRTELFEEPEDPTVGVGKVLRALVTVPLYHPLELLYFSTIPLYWADDRDTMLVLFWIGLFIVWVILSMAGLHNRFMAFFVMLRRGFFVGGQLVVSLLIIVIGYARLIDYGYISTLVESLPGYVLFTYFISAYVIFWTYEYWINRSLSEQILPLLAPLKDTPGRPNIKLPGQADYMVDHDVVSTDVKKDGRVMQIHAGSRLVVIGQTAGGKECFQLYERPELFHRIIFEHEKELKVGQDRQKARADAAAAFSDIQKRIRSYFTILNILLFLAVIAAFWYTHDLYQVPADSVDESSRHDQDPGQYTNLHAALFGDDVSSPPERAIAVAASGGGTRAALYASSVLRGLGEIRALNDVVLMSGVSGGGVALAYYASHRDRLVHGDGKPLDVDAWQCFHDTMAAPYIQDVLEGVFELRIAGGTRLGQLLDESFERNFYEPASRQSRSPACVGPECPARTFREINDKELSIAGGGRHRKLGLILNTALSGHPYYDSWRYGQSSKNKGVDSVEYSSNISSGSRLILTNLDDVSAFPDVNMTLPDRVEGVGPLETFSVQARDLVLKYVTVQDPSVKLSTAAALTANFPPVFSDAAVDIISAGGKDRKDRYWVTDGGAVENRGIISLLIALQDSLEHQCKIVCGWGPDARPKPPKIHIVVADASAMSVDYSPSRGINPKSGAAGHMADQLIVELLGNIESLYKELGGLPQDLHLHYLNMPTVFRTRGGLGTHWMLQEDISFIPVNTPYEDAAKEEKLRLSGKIAKQMIEHLFQPREKRNAIVTSQDSDNIIKRKWTQLWELIRESSGGKTIDDRVSDVWGWADQDNADEVWLNLCQQLQKSGISANCANYESLESESIDLLLN